MTRTSHPRQHHTRRLLVAAALLFVSGAALAVAPPQGGSPLAGRAFLHPDLYVSSVYEPVSRLSGPVGTALAAELAALGVATERGFVDLRSGAWGTLILRQPVIPGSGKGNSLAWSALGRTAPAGDDALGDAAWTAFRNYLVANGAALGVAPTDLGQRTVTVHGGGQLVQLNVRRQFAGLPVRDSFLSAVLNGGNLVLFGLRNWGTVAVAPQPTVSANAAVAAAEAHAGRGFSAGYWSAPHLEIVPVSAGRDARALAARRRPAPPPGVGDDAAVRRRQRLLGSARRRPQRRGPRLPRHQPVPEERARRRLPGEQRRHRPRGHRAGGAADALRRRPRRSQRRLLHRQRRRPRAAPARGRRSRTTLSGRYVRISDTCGAIDESAADPNDLDLGQGPGTDCAVPPGHSAGDTHASRTGFYEVNRIIEQAKGWLPDNEWLNCQLTVEHEHRRHLQRLLERRRGRSTSTSRAAAAATPARSPRSSTTSGATGWTTTTPTRRSPPPARPTPTWRRSCA